MALPGSSTHATESSETNAGLPTEHSEEGRPPQGRYAPIVEVAFNNGMWWSIPQQRSAELYAKLEAGQDAGLYMGPGYLTQGIMETRRPRDFDQSMHD